MSKGRGEAAINLLENKPNSAADGKFTASEINFGSCRAKEEAKLEFSVNDTKFSLAGQGVFSLVFLSTKPKHSAIADFFNRVFSSKAVSKDGQKECGGDFVEFLMSEESRKEFSDQRKIDADKRKEKRLELDDDPLKNYHII